MVQQEKGDLDEANLIQFLIAGHFFSGDTLLRQIKNLRAGEFLVFDGERVKRNSYYYYEINPDKSFNKHDVADRMNNLLRDVIVRQWEVAEDPGILLSGGLDSRYIFHTIADYVDNTSKLKTICWGEDLKKNGTDAAISSKLAKRYGTEHIVMRRHTRDFQSAVKDMFSAQSGMTDGTSIHADELQICRKLREEHGIKSLFRGDHSFGGSRERTTIQQGLLDLGMSFTKHIAGREKWFKRQEIDFFEAHSKKLDGLISRYKDDPSDIRDILRFYERVPMYLHQLNYFKYHYQEIYNPYLDRSVLDISQIIPISSRAKKKLFKECYKYQCEKKNGIPFAHKDDMINWNRVIAGSPTIYEYLKNTINTLPDFFNKIHFEMCLNSINDSSFGELQNSIRRIAKRQIKSLPLPKALVEHLRGNELRLTPDMLTLRLAVINLWFQLWIK
jgi:asparagine synthetase B (glutamine-hydrolysing)